jgi:hypothetical protein
MLASLFTCHDGTPSPDGSGLHKMLTFDAEIRRRPGQKLGIDCVHISSSKVCGLLVKSIDAGGVVAAWNAQSVEPSVFQEGDFVVGVNGVDGNEAGVSRLAAALRAAGDIIHIRVTGVRAVAASAAPEAPSPGGQIIAERIRWLDERSRVCSRYEWESLFAPRLAPSSVAACASTCGNCSICMHSISLDAKVRGLACGHYFHLECLGEWFMRDQTFELSCPMCRLPLADQKPAGFVSL